jgi:YebC/PmpR family DNA-binding regulatory protein
MSGHNKWSKIHRQKGIADQKRGREFSRLSQMIALAVKAGKSGEAAANPSLRMLLEKAREINMPKNNIERAIDRGLGKGEGGAALEEITYEGYGPGGVALMVAVATTNRNRSLMEIKSTLERFGGSLGGPGSAAYALKFRVPVSPEVKSKVEALVEALEEYEDVERVAHNAQ